MGVKGQDILNSHVDQFLKRIGTVQRFTVFADALTTLIEVWHDYVDSARFSADGSYHAL